MTVNVLTIRISSIRSQKPNGFGGAIFTGIEVDEKGWRKDATTHYVVNADWHVLPVTVERGQFWRVTGTPVQNTIIVNGYRLTEATIRPQAMELLRPSGDNIVMLLAEGERFIGVGQVKAQRLWDHFGEALYGVLDIGDVARLKEVLPEDMAERLTKAWRECGDSFTLQWLQSKGFPASIGRKLLAFYGKDASSKIEEDPYRLLSFTANWKTTDTLARKHFNIAENDPRRLAGAIEEALYAAFDAGHTYLTQANFKNRLSLLLSDLDAPLIVDAVAVGSTRGSFVIMDGRLHATGPYLMESAVAEAISTRVINSSVLLQDFELEDLINAYELEIRAQGNTSFALNEGQRDALAVANANNFAIITGGAGTGKTTVLRAFFRMCDSAGFAIFPMALSGRAAKRITEATGRSAQTIAGFIKHFKVEDAPQCGVVVVDESSMCDLPSIYRVVRLLPPTYRLVLVGDQNQLPPVGPGLLLHELAHYDALPLVELTDVRRYGGAIATAAAEVRAGCWPELSDDHMADMAFLDCSPFEINKLVLNLYGEDRCGSQILCATRNNQAGGVRALNAACQNKFNAHGTPLLLWNDEFDQRQGTGLRAGDPVICLKNDWELGLQNGSLGTILSVIAQQKGGDSTSSLGQILWDDGQEREITAALLPSLELAHAITIHKAQGSAFKRIIVPITKSRMLDRTLLYTAITRAEKQVILVGDWKAAKQAALNPPHAASRRVALKYLLAQRLA
jgi:exodeoxyribonuclease V alpha subunit